MNCRYFGEVGKHRENLLEMQQVKRYTALGR